MTETDPSITQRLAEALTELVALKKIKDEIEIDIAFPKEHADYAKRKPLAWAAAREALAAYAASRAEPQAPAGERADIVGDTHFEGWLSKHTITDVRGSKLPVYHKQDMREAYWAGYQECAALTPEAAHKAGQAPYAEDYARRAGMAVTKEWCRGWNDCRDLATSPAVQAGEQQAPAGERSDGHVEGDARELRQMLADCAIYLKDGETPAQRIERERRDTEAVLNLLIREKQKVADLLAAAHKENQ